MFVYLYDSDCHAYLAPNLSMIALLSIALCKAPMIYDLVVAYRSVYDKLLLLCIINDIT